MAKRYDDLKGVKIQPREFAHALDQLITDPAVRDSLNTRPIETLPKLGITIDDEERAALVGKLIYEASPAVTVGGRGGDVAETYVKVGIEVAVGIVAGSSTVGMVEETLQEVQAANVQRMTQAARARQERRSRG